ncbi:MAG: antibiotic biosynthesis monooxygenase [Alphaproteobacteria bacterium]|nr:antibiotic biosynthesis monooxygenase [Alphaproteobacteria bacterium]
MRRTLPGIIFCGLLGFCLPAAAQSPAHSYVVTVDFGTAPENFERFKVMMAENAKASVANEAGCQQFNVYELATTPNHLFLYEVYDDEAAFQQHLAAAHYKHFKDTSDPIITSRGGTRGIMLVAYRKPS